MPYESIHCGHGCKPIETIKDDTKMNWLKSSEVTKTGWYMIGRTDDPDWTPGHDWTVKIIEFKGNLFYLERQDNTWFRVDEMDEEVRWFGPIPDPYESEYRVRVSASRNNEFYISWKK